jgi:DNA-directed RNA polymerase subunit RPC12/RpoP
LGTHKNFIEKILSFALSKNLIGGTMQDKTLKCKDCGREFVWTVGEQEFYQEKGFTNEPTRCPECRKANKANRQQRRPRY